MKIIDDMRFVVNKYLPEVIFLVATGVVLMIAITNDPPSDNRIVACQKYWHESCSIMAIPDSIGKAFTDPVKHPNSTH